MRFAGVVMVGLVIGVGQSAGGPAPGAGAPTVAGCPVFPADNVWNTPIDGLKRDPRSEAYISRIGATTGLFAAFGSAPGNGIPVTVVEGNQPRTKMEFEYAEDSDREDYPIAADARVEGAGSDPGGDRHIVVVDKDQCVLYEVFAAEWKEDGSGWRAGSGAKWDLRSNALREAGKTSADAAGLPILPGLVRYDEVAAGEIHHALRFTAVKTQRAYVWPGRHFASKIVDASYPPLGVRFRLKAGVDISHYPKADRVILTALKRYGMFLADNGSNWYLTGEPDERWSDADLHRLRSIKGSDFEAVDESSLMVNVDSGRVK